MNISCITDFNDYRLVDFKKQCIIHLRKKERQKKKHMQGESSCRKRNFT